MNPVRQQIRSMLSVEPREGGFRAVLNINPDLTIFPDHFPDAQVLPGVCMVQAILLAGAQVRGADDFRLRVLKNAKMMHPMRPGDQVTIEADMTPAADGEIAIRARFTDGDKRLAEFSLVAADTSGTSA